MEGEARGIGLFNMTDADEELKWGWDRFGVEGVDEQL